MAKSFAASLSPAPLAKSLLAALALAAGLALSHPAKAMVSISVRFAPPPLMVYEQPMIPVPGYIWVPGYWAWDDGIDDYFWVPGQWVLPPFAGALWTPGYWAWNDGMYFFHRGYWAPVVGYYGGINYGYGYFGDGYYGGYWDRGVFNYNRACNHIDNRVVHVYNRTTIINNTYVDNRVSYNGGPGGVAVRPTIEQHRIEQQRHWDAMPVQRAVVREAREDRTSRYAYNRGEPERIQWRGVQPAMPGPRVSQPMQRPQWQEPQERMTMPERTAEHRERRMEMRPPISAMPPQSRMQPMPTPAPPPAIMAPPPMRPATVMQAPAMHPVQQEHRDGNPHREDRRRDRRDNGNIE